jgi:hypothetical protein
LSRSGDVELARGLILDGRVAVRKRAAEFVVGNPRASDFIAAARREGAASHLASVEIDAAYRGIRARDELLDEFRHVPTWAREWRIGLIESPEAANSRFVSNTALEVVRHQMNLQ